MHELLLHIQTPLQDSFHRMHCVLLGLLVREKWKGVFLGCPAPCYWFRKSPSCPVLMCEVHPFLSLGPFHGVFDELLFHKTDHVPRAQTRNKL